MKKIDAKLSLPATELTGLMGYVERIPGADLKIGEIRIHGGSTKLSTPRKLKRGHRPPNAMYRMKTLNGKSRPTGKTGKVYTYLFERFLREEFRKTGTLMAEIAQGTGVSKHSLSGMFTHLNQCGAIEFIRA